MVCSEAEVGAWLRGLRWQPLRLCMQHALLQATQSFADPRFELRRMADQVLRPLAEVVLWSELPLLSQLWAAFLPLVDSLPCWVSASTLLLALQRTHAVGAICAAPFARPAAAALVRSLHSRVVAVLPPLLPLVRSLVDGADSDKVALVGLQLLALLLARHPRLFGPQQRSRHVATLRRLCWTASPATRARRRGGRPREMVRPPSPPPPRPPRRRRRRSALR